MATFAQHNKIIVLTLAFLLLGAISIAAPSGKAYATAPVSAVGTVDYGLLINQHPDTQKANEIYRTETEQAKKEYDAKAPALSDKEKQDLNVQLMQRVEQKRQELLKAITDKINAAVKEVADAKGLTMIVSKTFVVYGGPDITDDVLKRITGK